MTSAPSPDVIQFCIDLRHVVEAARELGLEVTAELALNATLTVRETEAKMRGMTQQGNAIIGLMQQAGPGR